EYNPDVVHLHSTFSGVIGRVVIFIFFRNRKIKVIYCPHAFPFLMNSNKYKKKGYIICEKLLAKYTDKIICVGKNEYDEAIKVGVPESKMTIINNGVDIPKQQNNKKINNLDEYELLYVGRLDLQKGTDVLIDALKKIDNENLSYKIKIVMVGEAVNDETSYQSLTFKYINIEFTGWIQQELLFDYYIKSDCLIIPSRWEGLAMVPLEAISYKLPVITS
ncbi:glycosyltransferase, partial [Providencia rettgeri]